MSDLALESIRSLILFGIIMFLLLEGYSRRDLSRNGWTMIIGGFFLLLFGSLVDITDEFESLNRFVILGDTPGQALLEKIVGYLGGFLFLAIGLVRWIPTVTSVEERERLIKKLEQKNQDLDGFARVASHDLRAPLRAVDNLASWIVEDSAEQLSDESKRHLSQLRSRIQRMDRLLNDLLQYARVGRAEITLQPVDTAELVQESVDLLPIRENFTITVMPGMPTLVTQKVALGQVFQNLIQNAARHHNRSDGTIAISARERNGIHEFSVADDGPGIPEEFHEKIFKMYETLGPQDDLQGSGMGLAIVKRIVESRGGRIALDSKPGEGATFRFTWPESIEQGRGFG